MTSLSFKLTSGGLKTVKGRIPGTWDARWTLYERGLDTEYTSTLITLASGGVYTLAAGLEVEVNGTWTSLGGSVSAGDKIRVRATSLNEYYVAGVSGTLTLAMTIDGTACTFTLINIVDPATLADYWQRVDETNILRTDDSPIEVI